MDFRKYASKGCNVIRAEFNQDASYFTVALEEGFEVFSTDPFALVMKRSFESAAGIGLVSMLHKSNIFFMVGGGKNPRFRLNRAVLWDDVQLKPVAEITFSSAVCHVKLRKEVVLVATERRTFLYRLSDLELLDEFETPSILREDQSVSPVVDMSQAMSFSVSDGAATSVGQSRSLAHSDASCAITGPTVIVPSPSDRGSVLVASYDLQELLAAHPYSLSGSDGKGGHDGSHGSGAASNNRNAWVRRFRKSLVVIQAHEVKVACASVSQSGAFVATASDKGTIIRVFNSLTGAQTHELRRGIDRALIYSIAFSSNERYLAISSDKGTIHAYSLSQGSSSSSGVKTILSGGGSASAGGSMKQIRSFAHFKAVEVPSLLAFGEKRNTLHVLTSDCTYFCLAFDPIHGGEMQRVACDRFVGEQQAAADERTIR